MKRSATFDVMRDLLDHEIQDSHEISCGMVDDVELVRDGDGMQVAALLVGPAAWQMRLPALARLLVRTLTGRHRIRVPFDEVQEISEVIRLRSPAGKFGLGSVDRRVGRWLRRDART